MARLCILKTRENKIYNKSFNIGLTYLVINEITPSMSRKGNCWGNAVIESSFCRMKVELVYTENYTTVAQVYSGVFEYIEVF